MDHIPTRHFNSTISFGERFEILKKYSGSDWDYVRQFLSETQQVTRSAVTISNVIKKHFDVDLFPSVFKVACKGWGAGGGTAYFSMFGRNGSVYLFWSPAKDFKAMNGAYSEYSDGYSDGFERDYVK
ncbi:hypothetical protein [Croceimicrobium sp.]|uniref:hypothetical protein n=1 Tax=Croceimicrobium sp. TaxID=2828340 RepID=UPI003BA8B23F